MEHIISDLEVRLWEAHSGYEEETFVKHHQTIYQLQRGEAMDCHEKLKEEPALKMQ